MTAIGVGTARKPLTFTPIGLIWRRYRRPDRRWAGSEQAGACGAVQVIADLDHRVFPEGTVVTIGAYDGVHLGHLAVIEEVRRLASGRGLKSAVVTFDRHPAWVVRPESA